MERFSSLNDYYAAQAEHPGFPADYAVVERGEDSYRLMVMTDALDIVLEQVSGRGEALLLGRVHDRAVIDALLGPVHAQRELQGLLERLSFDETVALLEKRPLTVAAEQELLAAWQERGRQADLLLEDGRRRSFVVVETSTLGEVDEEELHRGGQTDYGAVDWQRVCAAGESYLEQGGDPLDGPSAYEHGQASGLDEDEAEWLESLFQEPICPSGQQYGNGRHRAMALKAQGVPRVVVQTNSELAEARRKALLVQAGAPLMELTPLDELAVVPAGVPEPLQPTVDL